MTRPYTGGCACGALRYTILGEPAVMLDCQCRQCQRDSGTGHQSHLTFVSAEVTTQGKASHWQNTGDGGTVKRRAFCPTCGAAVWLTFPAMPDVFIVTPASLDEPERYRPQMVSWTASGQVWDHLNPEVVTFERMPTG
ncbi:GFA family protein [Pararhizobium sp.]|uniref:GFA family protein n=1 Tax=Pararhizobium sp. TaxID=1977563 RepID=UPI00271EF4FD|nr:GFA family protein [Pararhizobium sp.]MDO9417251.1 GFA family protein [Pararhizobium sp.]